VLTQGDAFSAIDALRASVHPILSYCY